MPKPNNTSAPTATLNATNETLNANPAESAPLEESPTSTQQRPWAFRATILALCLVSLVVTLDATIIAVALPKIANVFDTDKYLWMANCFVLAQTVVQPPLAQLCNIFGRRIPMIASLTIFAVGSGIAGGANNVTGFIAGRTIQGLGSGGLTLLSELIICDLVPLKERSKYFAIVLSMGAIGTIIGPPLGGVIAQRAWRWIFYLNLPIAGLVLLVMFFFLRLRHTREKTIAQALIRIDWLGSTLFILATSAFLFGLISGGSNSKFAWSSWRVIISIVFGIVGWICFFTFEASPYCAEPSVPAHLFTTRNSSSGFVVAFISSILMGWAAYFWPVYFQSLHGATSQQAGINILPFVAFLIPVSIVAGVCLTRFGKYIPLHFAGFGLCILGLGLDTLLTQRTNTATWASFQAVHAIGLALLFPSILPAILASLEESDAAAATGFFSFLRSLGMVWGITIPGLVFNNWFDHYSYIIDDPRLRNALLGGNAYRSVEAGSALVAHLPPKTRQELFDVYTQTLRMVWLVAIAFAACGFLTVFFEQHIALRTELDTQYGLEVKEEVRENKLRKHT